MSDCNADLEDVECADDSDDSDRKLVAKVFALSFRREQHRPKCYRLNERVVG